MKIVSFEINNFRSIRNLEIPIKSLGKGENESSSIFLVGINESGKSAILEAISMFSNSKKEFNYKNDCSIEAQEREEYIDLYADFEVNWETFGDYWKKQIIEKAKIPEDLANQIVFKKIRKNVYISEEVKSEMFNLTINDDLPFYQYVVDNIGQIGAKKVETIEKLSEINEITYEITPKNCTNFLKADQKILTKEKLEKFLATELKLALNLKIPKIQIWQPKPEFLINEKIDLNLFKEDTSISIPFRNIFHICGKTSDEEIKIAIERALEDQARCDELQERMSDKVTRYINRIWKEHKIRIRISINSNFCKVHVEDKDKKYAYYSMNQRSDGFKQFLSLILSLSVRNDTNKLKNNIILIDEPEIHLHPSGVRYLRDEILKIGKNNNVIVSTHSQYMIDVETPERHFIVRKEKSETQIVQISDSTSILDDKVLSSAFGLNLFKELLPKNIIIVEGQDDKIIISHLLCKLNHSFQFSIKSAGGASKCPAFARILNEEEVSAFILFDADKEGRDNKKSILDNQGGVYSNSNVYILSDVLPSLPNDATIEDLLPVELVKNFFDREIGHNFVFESNKALIPQLKNQSEILKSNKQKLDSLKIKLSKEFCEKYPSKNEVMVLETTKTFIENLIKKIKIENAESF